MIKESGEVKNKKDGKKKRKKKKETDEDRAYNEWLMQWRNVDFSRLKWLPKIQERKQIMAYKKLKDQFGLRMLRDFNLRLGRNAKYLYSDPSKTKNRISGIFRELTQTPHRLSKITP